MSEKPLHLHLAELPWLLFFSQGDRRRPRVSGLVSFGCQEQEEQKSRAGKVTSDTPAGLQALAAGNAGGKRGGGGGCVISRANPPTPSLSARGRRQPVPRPGISENPQPTGFCARPLQPRALPFDLWRVEPLPGRVQSAFPGQDRPTSLVPRSPRWRAPPPGQSRCGAGAGEGWSGGKDLEWVTQGGGAKNSRSLC